MVKRKSKKSDARKVKGRSSGRKAAPLKAKRGYDIHTWPRSSSDAPATSLD
jgi:hypothetical protein